MEPHFCLAMRSERREGVRSSVLCEWRRLGAWLGLGLGLGLALALALVLGYEDCSHCSRHA